jgi:NAD(P)H-hydrate repair Nnr-like enzyme with NAD(P)H-hydrate epimerase domain
MVIAGFGFHGRVEEPYRNLLEKVKSWKEQVTLLSIDVPTGWDVDSLNGIAPAADSPEHVNFRNIYIEPDAVISLTLPVEITSSMFLAISVLLITAFLVS